MAEGKQPDAMDGAGSAAPEARIDPHPGGAVFISYAPEDVAAAESISTALAGDFTGAETDLRRALEVDTRLLNAHYYLAGIYISEHRPADMTALCKSPRSTLQRMTRLLLWIGSSGACR